MSQLIEVYSNEVLPIKSAQQNIFNDQDTIVANSNAFNFAISLSVSSRIRQSLHQKYAVDTNSLSGARSLNFRKLYSTTATDLNIREIKKAPVLDRVLLLWPISSQVIMAL